MNQETNKINQGMSYTLENLKAIFLQKDKHAKALANFLFREVIEDAHSKYNICDKEIKAMCKQVVNRAALYLEVANDENKLFALIAMMSMFTHEWDNPTKTKEIRKLSSFIKSETQSLCHILNVD